MPVNQEGIEPPPSAPSNSDVIGAHCQDRGKREISMMHPVADGSRVSFVCRLDLRHDNTSQLDPWIGVVRLTLPWPEAGIGRGMGTPQDPLQTTSKKRAGSKSRMHPRRKDALRLRVSAARVALFASNLWAIVALLEQEFPLKVVRVFDRRSSSQHHSRPAWPRRLPNRQACLNRSGKVSWLLSKGMR